MARNRICRMQSEPAVRPERVTRRAPRGRGRSEPDSQPHRGRSRVPPRRGRSEPDVQPRGGTSRVPKRRGRSEPDVRPHGETSRVPKSRQTTTDPGSTPRDIPEATGAESSRPAGEGSPDVVPSAGGRRVCCKRPARRSAGARGSESAAGEESRSSLPFSKRRKRTAPFPRVVPSTTLEDELLRSAIVISVPEVSPIRTVRPGSRVMRGGRSASDPLDLDEDTDLPSEAGRGPRTSGLDEDTDLSSGIGPRVSFSGRPHRPKVSVNIRR